jgi:hypothetical protein
MLICGQNTAGNSKPCRMNKSQAGSHLLKTFVHIFRLESNAWNGICLSQKTVYLEIYALIDACHLSVKREDREAWLKLCVHQIICHCRL